MSKYALQGDDESWLDFVGEATRGGQAGGQQLAGDAEAYALLGMAVAEKNPAALAIAQRRIAQNRVLVRHKPMDESFDYNVDFGPVTGTYQATVGSVSTLSFIPQRHFQALKSMAVDTTQLGTNGEGGYGTSITNIFMGADFQKVANTGGTLTAFYAQSALGNGIKYRVCKAGLTMSVTVQWLAASTFFMSMFGRTLQ